MSRAPRVSVVIRCHNQGEVLEEAVDSVFAQTFSDVEIVVVNDASTDAATHRLLAAYRWPKTRVLHQEHPGGASARNAGVRGARGELVLVLEADDVLAPGGIEKAVALLDADPALTFVSSWLRIEAHAPQGQPERCDLAVLLSAGTVRGAAIARTAAVLAVGGFDVALGEAGVENWDLWMRLAEQGHRGSMMPGLLLREAPRVETGGEGHLRPFRRFVEKHEESFRSQVLDVLARKQAEALDLAWRNSKLEQALAPTGSGAGRPVAGRAVPETRAGEPQRRSGEDVDRIAQLEEALLNAERDLRELRASLSWRMTASVRGVHRFLVRLFGAR